MLALKTQSEQFNYLVEASPMATAVFTGNDMVIAAANKPMLDIWERKEDVIGVGLLVAFPEFLEQPFFESLRGVFYHGQSYSATEVATDLLINGALKRFYFSFTCKALKEEDDKIIGVVATATDVTDLALIKHHAAEAREHLAFALNAAKIGTWSFDVASNAVTLDQGSLALIGQTNQIETNYQNLREYVHLDDRKTVVSAMIKATMPGQGGECDVNFRIHNGQEGITWIRCKGKAYFDAGQTVSRFAGILLNITAEVKAQTDLERLAAIVDSSDDFCNYTDMSGNILYINPAGRSLIGLEDEPLQNSEKFAYHDTNSRIKIEQEVFPILLANGSWSGELVLINQKNNESIPIYKQFHLIKERATNTPICIAGIAKDLREELKVRKILADKNRNLQEIVGELEFLANTVPPVVWTSRPDGALDFINQRWYDQTGKTEEETLGFNWVNSVHPDDVQAASILWERSLATGQAYEVEFRVITITDEYRWFLVRALPLKSADGKIIKWYGTNTDIHHQKELEKQKDDFLAIASHELKTPVTSLKAYTQVVEAMFVKAGDQRNAMLLNRMNKQIDRLTKLIDDLLNVTKIRAGKLQINLAPFNFKDMIIEVIEEVQKTSSKHRINKTIKFDGDVYSDRARLYQVVVNLLTNAIKYSPENHKIDLFVTASQAEVQLSVKDYGIGIAQEATEKIFEQFYRVQGNSDHTFAGMGLGLYICSDIVNRLGGKIWVDSVEDEGSTFSFTLPIGV